jgi:hypothetical protein
MEACYGGTDVMERSCAVARGIDINTPPPLPPLLILSEIAALQVPATVTVTVTVPV